jgi:cupin 2 domain-containing protein
VAEAQLQQFLEKVNQLNAFVALSEADPQVRQQLVACSHHNEVVALAARHGFEIGRRWGEGSPTPGQAAQSQAPRIQDNLLAGNLLEAKLPQGNLLEANLLQGNCPAVGQETTQILIEQDGLRLERIHSCQAQSPEGFWYQQKEHEWVLLLQGNASLQFEDEPAPRQLRRGDSLWIEAGRRHRVVATDPAPGCVWVALFWSAAA